MESSHCWDCLFLQGAFLKPWHFGENFRILIHSLVFPFQLSLSGFFRRRLQVVGYFFLIVDLRTSCWDFSFVWYSYWCPLLSPVCWYPTARLAALNLVYLSLFLQDLIEGYPKFSERLLWYCDQYPRKPYTRLLFTSSLGKYFFEGLITFYTKGFLV